MKNLFFALLLAITALTTAPAAFAHSDSDGGDDRVNCSSGSNNGKLC
ncbi:MAG: hypothetical protein ACRCXM_15400 [Beijerinckiaceae bacterium]